MFTNIGYTSSCTIPALVVSNTLAPPPASIVRGWKQPPCLISFWSITFSWHQNFQQINIYAFQVTHLPSSRLDEAQIGKVCLQTALHTADYKDIFIYFYPSLAQHYVTGVSANIEVPVFAGPPVLTGLSFAGFNSLFPAGDGVHASC